MSLYFTFGNDPQFAYKGGWVKVIGKTREACINAFRKRFPDRTKNTLNCAFVYSEETFKHTTLLEKGNFGQYCHEIIVANN